MPNDHKYTWLADVVLALREMSGGQGTPKELHDWIRRNRPSRSRSDREVIRNTIYTNSSDSVAYRRGNPDVFRKVAYGIWALRLPQEQAVPQKSIDPTSFVLAQMSTEELVSFGGRGEAILAEIRRRIGEVRRKFNIAWPESGS